jgi:hypothetical protein
VTLNVTAGQTYVIFVDGYFGGSSGNFALTVMPPGTVTTDVSGKQLLVKDNPVQTKRKIVFQSKSPSIDTSSASGVDPVAERRDPAGVQRERQRRVGLFLAAER